MDVLLTWLLLPADDILLPYMPGSCQQRQGPSICSKKERTDVSMILITCVDASGGLLFNGRRQSQDRVLRAEILSLAAGKPLWMDSYTAALFEGEKADIRVDEDFLAKAGPGEYALLEDREAAPYEDRIEKIILYHWNRAYPGDLFFDIDVTAGWQPVSSRDFAGSSHDKITEEVYTR